MVRARLFRRAGALAALVLLAACHAPAPPNIVFISIDCLNQRQLETALDGRYARTLAELAGDSTMYPRAYAHAPWTTPSHMSMFTGLYPSQHGRDLPYGLMIQWNDFFSRVPTFETVADRLGASGYETAAFVGQGSISAVYGPSQGFGHYAEHRKAQGSLTDLEASVDDTLAWLGERDDSPFFLFFHTYDVHEPRPRGFASDREILQYVDQYLGKVIGELKARGLYDSSLIVLTGDHGSNMIETDDKCCVHGAGHYEENLKVPLLVKLPDQSEAAVDERLARHVDLRSTILEVAGVPDPGYAGPGVSLLGPAESAPELSYSEADGRCVSRRALVSGRYKYIYTPQSAQLALLQQNPRYFDETCAESCRDVPIEELFDLMKDPYEKQNLLEGRLPPERAEWLERFRSEMAGHLNLPRQFAESVVTEPREMLDEQQRKELQESLCSLGYIDCP